MSWFSRLFSAHVYPAPDSETWKPKRGLETTLTQGAGAHCPSPSTVTYSWPPSTKPPMPLKNSDSKRGGGACAAAAALIGRGAGRAAPGADSARASCSASVPWRLRSTARAADCRAAWSVDESRFFRRM